MSGIEYLLDTNFILGMLKSTPAVTEVFNTNPLRASQCAYSAVTRMELLGFPGITPDEESVIRSALEKFTYMPISAKTVLILEGKPDQTCRWDRRSASRVGQEAGLQPVLLEDVARGWCFDSVPVDLCGQSSAPAAGRVDSRPHEKG